MARKFIRSNELPQFEPHQIVTEYFEPNSDGDNLGGFVIAAANNDIDVDVTAYYGFDHHFGYDRYSIERDVVRLEWFTTKDKGTDEDPEPKDNPDIAAAAIKLALDEASEANLRVARFGAIHPVEIAAVEKLKRLNVIKQAMYLNVEDSENPYFRAPLTREFLSRRISNFLVTPHEATRHLFMLQGRHHDQSDLPSAVGYTDTVITF